MDFGSEDDNEWMRIKELITNWGISHTTLEEVFMKVIRNEEQNMESENKN